MGHAVTFLYDAKGQLVGLTNADGTTVSYSYDAGGNVLTATDEAGNAASNTYDAEGRMIRAVDEEGAVTLYAYDAGGRITKVTDKNGNETAYTYDGNGNIIKTTDALGTEVLFEYDANDQLIKMTQSRVDEYHEQAEQLVTLYEYDGRNLVTKVVQTTGSQELYVYDGSGNIVSKTDGDNYVTEYTYNSLDLVTHISYNGAKEVTYQYNKVGELVRMDDWLGATTFELDLLNRLTKVTDHKGNVVEYTYDAVGNQTSITYPDETEVSKTYDALGQLTQVTDAENQDYTYTYDDAGNVTKLVYPNGWVEDYTYDAEGNLLKTVDTDPFHNNKKSTKYQYTYDAEGNLVSEYKRDTTAGNNALTTTYAYDALNRLVSAHEEGVGVNTTRTYQYDTLGNLIREEQDGCVEYKYNGAHLDESKECGVIPGLIGTCRWEYTYDGRGNLVSTDKYTRTTTGMEWQNVAAYTYDETNRLVQGKNEDGEVSLYTYNGLGIRVGRELVMKDNTHGYTDFHDLTPSVDTGLTTPEVAVESYVIDYTSATFDPLTMDEDGGFSYRYVYGLDKLSVKITSEGTNWWGQHVTDDILKDYCHQDRLGSTTNLTDQFGRVVGRADYDEWGQVTYKEALSITSSYRRIWPQLSYTGHDYDDVLNLYYAKARFYSAEDKRFVAMDPVKGQIIEPLSLVPYVYCVDNPLRWVDPLGLFLEGMIMTVGAKDKNVTDFILGLYDWEKQALMSNSEFRSPKLYHNAYITAYARNKYLSLRFESDERKILQKVVETEGFISLFVEAVVNFQHYLVQQGTIEQGAFQTGAIDGTTWNALGLSFNKTIQDEFAVTPYIRGGSTIRMKISDNTIDIYYTPKIYFDSAWCMAEADKVIFAENIVKGVSEWDGEYEIYGLTTTVNVHVDDPQFVDKLDDATIYYHKRNPLEDHFHMTSLVFDATTWNPNKKLTVKLQDSELNLDQSRVIMHEFGHVLGLFDAYSYIGHFGETLGTFINPEIPFTRAGKNDIMRRTGYNSVVSDNNIEMLLWAWKNNRLQTYAENALTKLLGGEVSQAFYH